MLHRRLLRSARLRFKCLHLQTFPCRRCRILRRICLLGIRLPLTSIRKIRNSKLILHVNSMLTTRVLTRSLVQIAHVSRSSINILLPRLARRTIRIRQLTTTQEARAGGIQIINRLLLSLLSYSISNCKRALTINVMCLRQNILVVRSTLLMRRANNNVTRNRRSIMINVRTVTITKREISRRLRLIMNPLTSISTRTQRKIFRVINTFLCINITTRYRRRIMINVSRLLTLANCRLLRALSILCDRRITKIKRKNVTIFLLIR